MAIRLRYDQYIEKHPSDLQATLPKELKDILRYPINAVDAARIIREFTHLEYYELTWIFDQWAAETLLVEARVPIEVDASEDFWKNFDGLCKALITYFASETGSKRKPRAPVGTTLGYVGPGTNPRNWEAARPANPRRRRRWY